jgi:hypothetical protein
MIGAIRKRDILAHPLVTIRCFGWHVFVRALLAPRDQTFLSLLVDSGSLQAPAVKVPELVERCVDLELTAKRIYQSLSHRFGGEEAACRFFGTLARQEQHHAELLELCRVAAEQDGWEESQFAPWRDAVPRLEQQMSRAEAALDSLSELDDALRLVVHIETSELDDVFDSVVAASDSEFVRRLQAFQQAGANHVAYICQKIGELAPELAAECQVLRAAHARETG